jgi:hypothetical protein
LDGVFGEQNRPFEKKFLEEFEESKTPAWGRPSVIELEECFHHVDTT